MENAHFSAVLLLAKALCVKHQGFRDEAEIRFLYPEGFYNSAKQRVPDSIIRHTSAESVRDIRSLRLLPYIEFGIDLSIGSVLKRVIIGPAGNKVERANKIRALLETHGLSHVEVTASEIPFRA